MTKIIILLRTNFIMLLRQRALIITSLGLAIISMLVFGFLFGSNSSLKTVLGVVDQDHSSISAQVLGQLQKSDALTIYTGTSDEEQQALKDGQDAVTSSELGELRLALERLERLGRQLTKAMMNQPAEAPTQDH